MLRNQGEAKLAMEASIKKKAEAGTLGNGVGPLQSARKFV